MKSYHILSHTADIRIKVEAGSINTLFEAAFEALNQIIKPNFCKKIAPLPIKKTFSITSSDTTSLLIDFLSEVLTYSHTESVVFCKLTFQQFSQKTLQATIFGSKAAAFAEDIKAVTYHNAEVTKNKKDNYEIIITLDI